MYIEKIKYFYVMKLGLPLHSQSFCYSQIRCKFKVNPGKTSSPDKV